VIVIDASALSKYILKEPGWEDIPCYLKKGVSVDHVLKEVANSIWKAYSRGHIGLEDAEIKYSALRKIADKVIEVIDQEKLMDKAFKIALNNAITVYDALYVALAEEERLPLLTSDGKQADIAEKLGVKVVRC